MRAVFREIRRVRRYIPTNPDARARSIFRFGGECDDSRGTGCPDSFFIVRPSPTLFYQLAPAGHEG